MDLVTWHLCLNQGGSKIQEAYLIFQDFSEKYPMTSLVLNGKAVCCMHKGEFDEAEILLLEALNRVSIIYYSISFLNVPILFSSMISLMVWTFNNFTYYCELFSLYLSECKTCSSVFQWESPSSACTSVRDLPKCLLLHIYFLLFLGWILYRRYWLHA